MKYHFLSTGEGRSTRNKGLCAGPEVVLIHKYILYIYTIYTETDEVPEHPKSRAWVPAQKSSIVHT